MEGKNLKVNYFVIGAICVFMNLISLTAGSRGINYQAVVRNNLGATMPNQHVNLRFSIRGDSLTGGIAYRETDTATANQQGVFTVVIGGGNIVNGSFDSIHWASTSYYLQVEMDINGGSSFVDMGTSQLASVPYAIYANSAGAIDLAPTIYPTVTGSDSIVVGNSSYIVVTSTVPAASAQVTLSPGIYPGQVLCVAGASTAANGVMFTNTSTVQLGTSGGPNNIQAGSTIMFMWSGTKWLKMAYSSNQ